ncbi:MAG: hypothetical protein ACQEQ4_04410 [Fibrobacterota bacterium]
MRLFSAVFFQLILSVPLLSDTLSPLEEYTISSDTISFGAPVEVQLTFLPDVKIVDFPYEEGGLNGSVYIQDIEVEGRDIFFSIVPYMIENCTIPSFDTEYMHNDTQKSYATPKKEIYVLSATEENAHPYSVGTPLNFGNFPLRYIVWIMGSILFLVFCFIIYKKTVKKKKNTISPPPPPGEEARQKLRIIHQKDYIKRGDFKNFCFELSAVLKKYIGRSWQCGVYESTSAEFFQWIETSDISREQKQFLKRFIRQTDPVKFANNTPSRESMEDLFTECSNFIAERETDMAEKEKMREGKNNEV